MLVHFSSGQFKWLTRPSPIRTYEEKGSEMHNMDQDIFINATDLMLAGIDVVWWPCLPTRL